MAPRGKIQRKSRCHPRNIRLAGQDTPLDQSVKSKFAMPRNNVIGIADQRKRDGSQGRKQQAKSFRGARRRENPDDGRVSDLVPRASAGPAHPLRQLCAGSCRQARPRLPPHRDERLVPAGVLDPAFRPAAGGAGVRDDRAGLPARDLGRRRADRTRNDKSNPAFLRLLRPRGG
jgi:hypothetical protein